MALPTFVAQGAIARGTGTITPAIPSASVNDILLLFIETGGGTAGANPSISDAGGGTWTEVTSSPVSVGTTPETDPYTKLAVFWSRYDGVQTDPTVADTGNHQTARILAFNGCRATGNPWNGTPQASTEAASDTSGSLTGYTTTVNDCLIVAAITSSADPASNGTAGFSSWANSNLANVTERSDMQSTTGTGGDLGIATGELATAGAIGTTTVTLADAGYKAGLVIALAPEFVPTVALNSPADAASTSDTTPDLAFTGTDGNSDPISYQLQIATDANFGSKIYTANDTWVCPEGVTKVFVETYGAGGGGRTDTTNGGGGGGGGAYSSGTITVTPGVSYSIVVGTGGGAGTAGGDSYFDAGAAVKAKGGSGGTGTAGAAGGVAASGAGSTKWGGGTGGAFNATKGGGGGGAAGASVNGKNGLLDANGGGVASNAGAGFGAGGQGNTAASGSNGTAYGGGGGGGTKTASTTGGTGANGAVILTYSVIVDVVSNSISTTDNFDAPKFFRVPIGVTSVDVSVWGAGGGGGGWLGSGLSPQGGGGGGAYVGKTSISVSANQEILTTAGQSGQAGMVVNSGDNATDGQDSQWDDGSVLLAKAGTRGRGGGTTTGGTGGASGSSIGVTKASGGNGAAGSGSTGGGGGGSGGNGGAGGAGSGSAGGTAGSGSPGGAAGAGGNNNPISPSPATTPGAGGGGSPWDQGDGGYGGPGRVQVRYTKPANASIIDTTNGADTDPFASGDAMKYTVESALTVGKTYYWRVRAKDPAGSNSYGAWTTARSFTISASNPNQSAFFPWFPTAR